MVIDLEELERIIKVMNLVGLFNFVNLVISGL